MAMEGVVDLEKSVEEAPRLEQGRDALQRVALAREGDGRGAVDGADADMSWRKGR